MPDNQKKVKQAASDTQPEKGKSDDDRELLKTVRDRYETMWSADEDNRRDGMDDMRFVNIPGDQWTESMKQERGNRPCYEFNKVRVNGKKVINEIRANRPAGKVRGVEGGDKETAEIYDGLLRNISNVSNFETIQDYAAEYQVNAGMGAWRVTTEYRSDSVFDQDIFIEYIKNPFCLLCDPAAQDVLKSDAYDWILTERMANREYEAKYPDAEPVDFETEDDCDENEDDWEDDEFVRIAEYWWKEPTKKTIHQLQDGTVVDEDSDEFSGIAKEQIVKTREIDSHDIMMTIVSGNAVLEPPTKQAGKEHRFVMIYGEYIVIDGKTYWWGLPRFAKDAQRSHNISNTSIIETIAMAPQAKVWLTAAQGKGLEAQIAEAHRKNYPVLYYNEDPKSPGPPKRIGAADIPTALIAQSEISSQQIDDSQGVFEASRGEDSNETSGVALARKQRAGALVTFNYPDNMAKGVRRTYEIIIDLIPHVLDTERELRVLGADGAEDYIRVNQFVQDPATGEAHKVNDLAKGTFDVTVTTGPSFATQREEAAETYSQLAQADPLLMPTAGDLVYQSMDLPFSDEIAERRKATLPPEIQALISQDADIPPEVQAAMQQVEQAQAIVQEQTRLVQEAAAEVEQNEALADKAKSEVAVASANLNAQESDFEAKVTAEMAKLNQMKAEIAGTERQNEFETATMNEAREIVSTIDEMVASFMEASAKVMEQIEAKCITIVEPKKPKLVRVESKKVKGKTVITPVYEEGGTGEPQIKSVEITREGAKLVGVPSFSDAKPADPTIVRTESGPETATDSSESVKAEDEGVSALKDVAERLADAAEAMSAPKVLVRDKDGRPVGVKSGTPSG